MRFGAVLLLAVLAVSGGCHARKLLEEAPANVCLADPQFTDIRKLLDATGILPDGLPAGVTTFLPTNAAVAALIKGLAMPNLVTVEDVLKFATSSDATRDLIVPKFISTLLYHIVPVPDMTLEDLAAESPVDTAFIHGGEAFTLEFSADGMTITTGKGQAVAVSPMLPTCETYVYPVDAVLLPAELLSIEGTTLEEALAILASIGGGGAPAPAPGPNGDHHHHDGMDEAGVSIDSIMDSLNMDDSAKKAVEDALASGKEVAGQMQAAYDEAVKSGMSDVDAAMKVAKDLIDSGSVGAAGGEAAGWVDKAWESTKDMVNSVGDAVGSLIG